MAKRVNCLPRFVTQRCSNRYWSVLLREHGEALALIGSGDGVKLAIAYLTLLAIEMGGHEVYAARVAHEDDLVGQLFGQQVEVEYATIAIDNEF